MQAEMAIMKSASYYLPQEQILILELKLVMSHHYIEQRIVGMWLLLNFFYSGKQILVCVTVMGRMLYIRQVK